MKLRVMLAAGCLVLVSACTHAGGVSHAAHSEPDAWMQARATLPDSGPPVDAEELYDGGGSCPGEGCQLAHWQAVGGPTPMRDQPTRAARVIATIYPGEWFRADHAITRWRPRRGVVVGEIRLENEHDRLNIGDVVYSIDYEGEGYMVLWRLGDSITWEDTGDEASGAIRWDPRADGRTDGAETGGEGWWVEVRRRNGQTGWVLGAQLTCTDGQDPTDECRARNSG